MKIDDFYTDLNKSSFYLGKISSVYRDSAHIQVENLSLLDHRMLRLENLLPNTINYFVVIDSTQGLFLGEVFQAKVNSSVSVHDSISKSFKEDVYPEIAIDVIGLLSGGKFKLTGFKTVGLTDKVYIANNKLIEKFWSSIEINEYNGQGSLKDIAQIFNGKNEYLSLQPNTLFDRHLMVVGTTNSGKSTSALSILDKLVKDEKKILLIDPTGEYHDSFKDDEILKLKLSVDTVVPIGSLDFQQWSMIFQTNDGSQGTELMKAINSLRYQYLKKMEHPDVHEYDGVYKKIGKNVKDVQSELNLVDIKSNGNFELSNLPEQILAEAVSPGKKPNEKNIYFEDSFRLSTNTWLSEKVKNVLDNSNFEDFFSNDESKKDLIEEIDEFIETDGSSLYIDSSEIGTNDGIGAMVIDLISKQVISKKRNEINPFVMYIDEVHRYTQGLNDYTSGLVNISREGRKKGIFLFLTTQNPKDVPDILLGQIGTMIIHRLTQLEELNSIKNQVSERTIKEIMKLNKGEAILASINLLKDIYIKFIKSGRNHDNDTPLL